MISQIILDGIDTERISITISIFFMLALMIPQIVFSQGNQSSLTNSTLLRTDYALFLKLHVVLLYLKKDILLKI